MTIQDTALRMINEHGVAVSLARNSGTFDAVAGTKTSAAEGFNTNAVPETIRYGLESDELIYLFDPSIEPKPGDKATISGKVFGVKDVELVEYKEVPIYYKVWLSK